MVAQRYQMRFAGEPPQHRSQALEGLQTRDDPRAFRCYGLMANG